MSNKLVMVVEDLFYIGDKTILTGKLQAVSSYISNVDCRLLVNGKELATFTVGETMDNSSKRSLWTNEKLPLRKRDIKTKTIQVVSII